MFGFFTLMLAQGLGRGRFFGLKLPRLSGHSLSVDDQTLHAVLLSQDTGRSDVLTANRAAELTTLPHT